MSRALWVVAVACAACSYTLPPSTSGTGATGSGSGSGSGSGTSIGTGAVVSEVFVQAPAIVDVLFVIDDSCSMADDQQSLAEAFPPFLDAFLGSGADWHVGVVTTDIDAPAPALAWIDQDTADPVAVFDQMADVGTTGSGTEKGLGAAYLALEDPANAAFLRTDSGLHLIVLSDEDDATASQLISTTEFIDWLDALAQDRPAVSFNAIVQTDDVGPHTVGTDYLDVNAAIGGLVYDIDDVDYTAAMDALGLATSSLVTTYCLAALPDPATVDVSVVTVDGATLSFVQGADYAVDSAGCVSLLAFVPSPGDEVHVSYVPAP